MNDKEKIIGYKGMAMLSGNKFYCICDKCNKLFNFDYTDLEHKIQFHFCPECEADMQGDAGK